MSTDQRSPFSLPTALTETSMFCGVAIDSGGNAVLPAAGAAIVGVLYGLSGPGTAASIRGPGDGIVKLQYGGTVTLPATLKCNGSGQFVTASTGDIAAGAGVAVATVAGNSGDIGGGVLIGSAAATAGVTGTDDIVLGTTAPSNTTLVTFVETTGTATGVLANGIFVGQKKEFVQSVAASTPVGTITGAFASQANVAKTTLALGTAVGMIGSFVWNGTAWRQVATLGGSGSSLS